MNADTGSEPESPKKRGRIPQSAWPEILERYNGGATLSAIAREFECTPSAISYIIKKAEAASGQGELNVSDSGAVEPPATAAESQAASVPIAPVASAVEAAPSTTVAESEAPADRAAGSRLRPRLTRPEARADDVGSAPAAPAPSETLRLSRPEPAPQPVIAPPAVPTTVAPAPVATDGPRPTTSATGPVPPVDAVEGRLRDTAKACITAYRGWRQQPNEGTIQSLSETVHELRKALSRIEIDMSASRREEQAIRPIPIPAHRASRRPQ
jgi:transposase-like protein